MASPIVDILIGCYRNLERWSRKWSSEIDPSQRQSDRGRDFLSRFWENREFSICFFCILCPQPRPAHWGRMDQSRLIAYWKSKKSTLRNAAAERSHMFSCYDILTDRRRDRQTSSHNGVCAMLVRRAVKTCPNHVVHVTIWCMYCTTDDRRRWVWGVWGYVGERA